MLGPGVRRLGRQPGQLGLRLVESAELEERDALLAPRLAVLRLVLERFACRGERFAGPPEIVERHRFQEMKLLHQPAVAPLLGAAQRAPRVPTGALGDTTG